MSLLAHEAGQLKGSALLTTSRPSERKSAGCVLLYLNDDTAATWPLLQEELEAVLPERQPLILLHEQREGHRPASFDTILEGALLMT